jgi:hypothetical protein
LESYELGEWMILEGEWRNVVTSRGTVTIYLLEIIEHSYLSSRKRMVKEEGICGATNAMNFDVS